MFSQYKDYLQSEIPERPEGKYTHIVVLRSTDSYAVFKTDDELNTARVRKGLHDPDTVTRLAIFKRKQTTPERLTGRELLRRYAVIDDTCKYNESFCGSCPDCVLYGYAIGDSGSEKSKVYTDTAYSITSYDTSHETFTLNAPYEDGTMTKGTETTYRFSEQDHVLPETFFPSVVTLRDGTPRSLAYLINNIRRTKLYGAQTTRTGHMTNRIIAIVFADGEVFSNLRLTQAVNDILARQDELSIPLDHDAVFEATLAATKELVIQDGVVYEIISGGALNETISELDEVFTSKEKLQQFLREMNEESRAYAERVGNTSKKKKGK
ncbi:MAG: type I-D CRISPR-associated protein Cas7/Csc2 [Limnochordia bacterium]|nr:type I-D CRISPR-associated protein Cas7/Csc2 [Limnochordia bacterium]